MAFRLKPVLSEMKELYLQPISRDRFNDYISKLQGTTKGDLSLPIGGFNPMAKAHILQNISSLETLEVESIMSETISEFNTRNNLTDLDEFLVVINIADDLKGGWTNRYTTDFDSKFKLNAFIKRNFCVPYYWTSESYSKELIQARTVTYLSRTLFRMHHPPLKTLEEHLKQEIFVAKQLLDNGIAIEANQDLYNLDTFFHTHRLSDAYDIFNFFYGDHGSNSLGFSQYGITEYTGFDYAMMLAGKK